MSYHDIKYWNRRYSVQTEPYDWYQDAETTANVVMGFFEKLSMKKEDMEILVSGCVSQKTCDSKTRFTHDTYVQGTSQLGPLLYSKGYKNITNVDISPVVIELQKKRYHKIPIDFLKRDASNFSDFPSGYFDVIIDKAMTDSILCGKLGVRKVCDVLKEAHRVLKAGGMYVMISHGIPESRTCYINEDQWMWQHIEIGTFFSFYTHSSHKHTHITHTQKNLIAKILKIKAFRRITSHIP
jgi:EEF1A lysine methyltransferase 4